MKEILYLKGDVTNPIGDSRKIIVHCVNDLGVMGAGVALALLKKWPNVKKDYQKWHRSNEKLTLTTGQFALGQVQFVKVEKNIVVANMVGQCGICSSNSVPPIRYGAIEECLGKVCHFAKLNSAEIHAPRFGAGLAGGDWEEIEKLIVEKLSVNDVGVTIYDYD